MEKYIVVSADGHAGPPAHVYREYLDPAFHEQFDAHQHEINTQRAVNEEFVEEWDETTGDLELKAAFDSEVRLGILDTEGVTAEVLFPDADVLGTGRAAASPFGSGLASGADAQPDQVLAGARAHNRWLADFVAEAPTRRVGCAVVPITHGVEDAVAEIRWAADHGLRGAMIPTRWFDRPAYLDPGYEPVWSALEETGLVLHTHSGAGPADYDLGPGFMGIYAAEAWWWAARPLWVLILSGVFERHPTLKYVIAENGAWWAPDILARMDEKWEGHHATRKFGDTLFKDGLSMKPSAYMDRNCYLAASTPTTDDIERRDRVGIGNLLWGNDLPHPEGTYPHTRWWIADRFRDVPVEEARRILGENAIEVYGLDRDTLAGIADKICPTVDEVHGAAA